MSLPALTVFSVSDLNNEVRYLSFTGPHKQLRYGPAEGVFSDIARFAVEPAGDGLVHIRSTFENYYWARTSRFEPWLSASAPEKVEDTSKDECTLFRPLIGAGNAFVRFVHVQSRMNVVMLPAVHVHAYNLCLEYNAPTEFRCIDLGALCMTKLPTYVMFLGDNDKYLSVNRNWELHFAEHDKPSNLAVGFEASYTRNGNLRLYSLGVGRRLLAVIQHYPVSVIKNPVPETDTRTLFDTALSSPPSKEVNGIALRSLANNRYCHRDVAKQDVFITESDNQHSVTAWLRHMYLGIPNTGRVNIHTFRNAWRGPNSTRPFKSAHLLNSGSDQREATVPTQYLARRTITFRNSISSIVGNPTVFVGRMPHVGSTGELVFPDVEANVNASWGSTISDVRNATEDVKLVVPPRSTLHATLFVNIATYEVPFSYMQHDEFPSGDRGFTYPDDGVFVLHSEESIGVTYDDIQPLTAEVLDESIYTDLRALELEGINVQDTDIKPNASDEVKQE